MSAAWRWLALLAASWALVVGCVDASAVREAIEPLRDAVDPGAYRALVQTVETVCRALWEAQRAVRTELASGGLGAAQWSRLWDAFFPERTIASLIETLGNLAVLVVLRCLALGYGLGLVALFVGVCAIDAVACARSRRRHAPVPWPAVTRAAAVAALLLPWLAAFVLSMPVVGAETVATALLAAAGPAAQAALRRRPLAGL